MLFDSFHSVRMWCIRITFKLHEMKQHDKTIKFHRKRKERHRKSSINVTRTHRSANLSLCVYLHRVPFEVCVCIQSHFCRSLFILTIKFCSLLIDFNHKLWIFSVASAHFSWNLSTATPRLLQRRVHIFCLAIDFAVSFL